MGALIQITPDRVAAYQHHDKTQCQTRQ